MSKDKDTLIFLHSFGALLIAFSLIITLFIIPSIDSSIELYEERIDLKTEFCLRMMDKIKDAGLMYQNELIINEMSINISDNPTYEYTVNTLLQDLILSSEMCIHGYFNKTEELVQNTTKLLDTWKKFNTENLTEISQNSSEKLMKAVKNLEESKEEAIENSALFQIFGLIFNLVAIVFEIKSRKL